MTTPTPSGDPVSRTSPEHSATALTFRDPPRLMRGVFNRLMRAILSGRMHGALDRALLLVHVTGRRTGRHYTVPVRHHDVDGRLTVFTAGGWRANLRGGADIEITHHGHRQPMHAALIEDPAAVAPVFHGVIDRLGWKAAQRTLSVSIPVRRTPTVAELEQAARTAHLSIITLTK